MTEPNRNLLTTSDVIARAEAAAARLRDYLHAASDKANAGHMAMLAPGTIFEAAGAFLQIIRDLKAIEAARNPLFAAAELALAGELTEDELDDICAAATLREQGITNPTDEQRAQRVSELRTARAFVSAEENQ